MPSQWIFTYIPRLLRVRTIFPQVFLRLISCAYFSLFQFLFQELSRIAGAASRYFFGSTCRHNVPSFVSSFGTQVDHVVGTLNHIHVMLDDYDAVSSANQCVERVEQLADVMKMQSRSRFVEDEERWVCLLLTQVQGKFDALVFSPQARKRTRLTSSHATISYAVSC